MVAWLNEGVQVLSIALLLSLRSRKSIRNSLGTWKSQSMFAGFYFMDGINKCIGYIFSCTCNLSRILGEFFVHSFARVIAPFFLFLNPVYLNFYVTNLSGQQRDLQLYVESEPHRGLKFYHQKYNPLTPWWNERGSNPCLFFFFFFFLLLPFFLTDIATYWAQ